MVIHCYDFVQGQRECDLGSQWSGWGGSHIFPQDLAAAFLQVHPCWFAFREPVNYLGVGCVCVCVWGGGFHLHGEEMWRCKYSAPGIAFLKTLVSQGVQHVCWRKDQCLQEWGFSCGCGSQPPGFPGAATAATSATQGRQGHCRCVCVRCADPQRDEWLHTRQHLRVRFRVKLWTG